MYYQLHVYPIFVEPPVSRYSFLQYLQRQAGLPLLLSTIEVYGEVIHRYLKSTPTESLQSSTGEFLSEELEAFV